VELAGGGHAVEIDVRDAGSIEAGVAGAVEKLGGVDAVLYAAGVARLALLADESADDWRAVLETNLVGAALVARAAAPHLAPAHGVMAFCSSTTDGQPRWGLSLYGVSKAALNRLVDSLRAEHRDVRFLRATIGPTVGTEFGDAFERAALEEAFAQWVVTAQHTAQSMSLESVADVLLHQIELLLDHPDVDIPHVAIEPPGGPLTMPPTADSLEVFFASLRAEG
jgi:NAD(P)-dependent dehydrogenase (short-subunit alcohol dehydrogenase family)